MAASKLDDDAESLPPVEIPHAELTPEALRGVVESFVLREGTDYGATEFPLDQKVTHILRQLKGGEARIFFDPNSETVNIVVTNELRKNGSAPL